MSSATEWANYWVDGDEAQECARRYDETTRAVPDQRSIFQAHLDGQHRGYREGYQLGREDLMDELFTRVMDLEKLVKGE